jgi:hypothetical protein
LRLMKAHGAQLTTSSSLYWPTSKIFTTQTAVYRRSSGLPATNSGRLGACNLKWANQQSAQFSARIKCNWRTLQPGYLQLKYVAAIGGSRPRLCKNEKIKYEI